MRDVLAIILGGGQGRRLFPLTERRAKPAVPLAGKYRLIDIPVSNCLHADIRRIFILTQFNSASLNRHIGQTYRLDTFSRGFVEILAAEQTPDNPNWYQGTADAVRQAVRHFERHDADYYLILSGDHLYRMNYAEFVDDHIDRQADITVAALPVTVEEASGMGILRFDRTGQISGFEEKPSRDRLLEIGRSLPAGAPFGSHSSDKPFVASMGVYVFSRDVLLDILAGDARHRLRQGGHPRSARPVSGPRVPVPRLLGGCRHHSVLLRRQHPADPGRRAVPLLRPAAACLHASPISSGLAAHRLRRQGRDRRRRLLHRPGRDHAVGRGDPDARSQRGQDPAVGPARRGLLRHRRRSADARQRPEAGHRRGRRARPCHRGQERADRRRRATGRMRLEFRKPTAPATSSGTA